MLILFLVVEHPPGGHSPVRIHRAQHTRLIGTGPEIRLEGPECSLMEDRTKENSISFYVLLIECHSVNAGDYLQYLQLFIQHSSRMGSRTTKEFKRERKAIIANAAALLSRRLIGGEQVPERGNSSLYTTGGPECSRKLKVERSFAL